MPETVLGLDEANRQSPLIRMSLGSNSPCSFKGSGLGEKRRLQKLESR